MNKLIRAVLLILFMLAFCLKSFSQQPVRVRVRRRYYPVPVGPPVQVRPYTPNYRIPRPPAPRNRMAVVKENFIIRQLRLTPQQTNLFLPLYRQYVQDQTIVMIKKRQNNATNTPNGSAQVDNELEYETELLNIRKHYRDEFLRIMPPEKVSQLYKSERAFNDEAVRILGERGARP